MVKYFSGILIFLGLFASCCNQGKSPDLGKKKTQVISISCSYSPFSADPRKRTDPVTTVMSYMLYEGLTRLEPDGTAIPALAERIEISKDRKEYFFFLRKSTWSDGSPLTAYHFEAAWKKALNPNFPSRAAHLLFPIKNAEEAKRGLCSVDAIGVETIDEQKLLVRLKRPTPYFLQLTAYPTYFPVPYSGDEVLHPNQQSAFLTNGPFRLSSWRDDDEIVAVKNPYYWNAKEVKLDAVHALIISDEATALKLFDQGKIDYFGGLISPLSSDTADTLKKTGRLKKRAIVATTFASFNVNRFPFTNVHIRKAFALAVDKKSIIDYISQMDDDIASGLVPQVFKGAAKSVYQDYNPKAALKNFEMGLQELGITRKEFPAITYYYLNIKLHSNLALAIQSQWKDILGIEVKLQGKELKHHLEDLRNHRFQIGQMSWIGQYCDRICFLKRILNENSGYSGWENPHYERLLEDSYDQEGEKRAKLLDEAEQLFMDDTPILPIYHFHSVYATNPHLKELAISPLGDVQFHKAFFYD
ncbi:MAG: peptide ABC transporter substrate-binding protein [Simkaniaceae bacterium]|nr:peptide ABC transporter substrate-binding protein [Simkaniaceae bacterium]